MKKKANINWKNVHDVSLSLKNGPSTLQCHKCSRKMERSRRERRKKIGKNRKSEENLGHVSCANSDHGNGKIFPL